MSSALSLIKFAAFSSNYDSISPISLIKQFFIAKSCQNISYIKSGHVEFDHQMVNAGSVHIHFIEIIRLDKKYSICSMADSFITIIDLQSDSSYAKIERIFSYMKEYCNCDKKVYIIGFYSNKELIPEVMKEDSIASFIESQNILHDYYELQLDKTEELIKVFDLIIEEVLEVKKKALEESSNKKKVERDVGESGSICSIY